MFNAYIYRVIALHLSNLEHQPGYLSNQLNDEKFVEATILQLNKDLLGLSTDELNLALAESVVPLDNLIQSLAPILTHLAKLHGEQLAQFIYRVDLSEKAFITSLEQDSSLQNLAYLVIEREAKKVYLRRKFS